VLGLAVADTTRLTATLATGGLLGFGLASRVLGRGADPFRLASHGALIGVPAFLAVILAVPLDSGALFVAGTLLIGFGGGLFGHGTLTATMALAPKEQVGLALGAWGAVQATAAGSALALGGILRDIVGSLAANGMLGPALRSPATGYVFVYSVEIAMMLAAILAMAPLVRATRRPAAA
jgi:BCD family chlorophyll transporter-like MFS transporter